LLNGLNASHMRQRTESREHPTVAAFSTKHNLTRRVMPTARHKDLSSSGFPRSHFLEA
jgi:hypothetical protein